MSIKNQLLYMPLIGKICCVSTKNDTFNGVVLFESKELIHLKLDDNSEKFVENSDNIKKILKNSICQMHVYIEEKLVEVDPSLFNGTLIYRLKKMK